MSRSSSNTPPAVTGRECYHCKQWIAPGETHDCWTTTEAALLRDLDEDLREAYDRIREEAVACGDQRIYASHHSIMFSRRACFCFVRPRRRWLDVCVFLGRGVTSPLLWKAMPSSRTKIAHLFRITHRDQVEAPLTEWLAEAWAMSGQPAPRGAATAADEPASARKRAAKKR
ncbi:hypothetical protein TBR22_A02010 [Luteitalea sp. TBR-22]|uniref:DUF5655 domain-containing protein n=1 Tax=Luteitalea sp. TBR-22 TaxID=2802971 RepID=UPI001AF8592C|nr:DUF5655 domain-containing protein [Luteitalea sp. TBR-22]BCS31002.1 hypothetical protein TBR22_A02010 [Luteitalea sp. TBR-22]